MVIGCCEKCKNIDLIDENQENTCPKCGGRFVSLGVDVDEWNELDNDGMLALVEKALAPKKPVIKQLQQPSAPAQKPNLAGNATTMNNAIQQNHIPQNNAYPPRNGYPQQNPNNQQQQRLTRPAPQHAQKQASKRQPSNTPVGRILFDTPLLPIICIGLCIWDFFSDPPALTYILSVFIIGLAVFTIVKKCRVWGLSIVAIVLAFTCIVITAIGTALGLDKLEKKDSSKDTSIPVTAVEKSVSTPVEAVEEEKDLPPQSYNIAGVRFEFPGDFIESNSQTDPDGSEFKLFMDKDEARLIFLGTAIIPDSDSYVDLDRVDDSTIENVKEMLKGLTTQCFTDNIEITSRKNDKEKSGRSGHIIYYTHDFDGVYELSDAGVRSLSFFVRDQTDSKYKIGIVVYVHDKSKYPNDDTYEKMIGSSNLNLEGYDTSSSNNENDVNSESETKASSGGVDPDMKAFLDSYEDFMNEYVDFMKRYTKDPANAISMLSDYYDMLKRYEDFAAKADKYDQKSMSKEDLDYYLDTLNRINKKYLEVLQ